MKRNRILVTLISLFLMPVLFTLGCSDDDGGGPTDGGPTDTDPPGVAMVNAVDGTHVDVEFDEAVEAATAERNENYLIIEAVPTASSFGLEATSPGDTIHVGSAALGTDGRTVSLQLFDFMNSAPYDLTVTGVEDKSGNRIGGAGVTTRFTGTNTPDTTPPTIVDRTPSPGATGVGVGTSVVVQFSEGMDYSSVDGAFSWTFGGGTVPYEIETFSANEFVFRPLTALSLNTVYTVTIAGTAQDFAGNPLAMTTWMFTTTAIADNTPPRVTGISPANGATNVSVNTDFRIDFSEAIDPNNIEIIITPDPGDGVPIFSNGGRRVTFDPFEPLMDNTQYAITVPPGGIFDFSGNGNVDLVFTVFSTGPSLASGGIAGTLSGDPLSDFADDPQGAIVFVSSSNPFADTGDDGPPDIAGTTTAGAGGVYSIGNLPDDDYFPVSILDSNDDGMIDPDRGDAIGAYGVDFVTDFDIDSVTVMGGTTLNGIDFGLIDPPSLGGLVSYEGSMYAGESHMFGVAVFDTSTWDAMSPSPEYETEGFLPSSPEYRLSGFDDGLDPSVYYVGAFYDVDDNSVYTNGIDPVMFYGGGLVPVSVLGGADELDVDIAITDNTSLPGAAPWTPGTRNVSPDPRLRRLADAARAALAAHRESLRR